MSDIKEEINLAIQKLEEQGVHKNSYLGNTVGLGDKIEEVLKSMGITEQRFKEWFNLKECGCSKRKAWLNSIFSWKQKNN